MSEIQWPALPAPGELLRVPLTLPPMLLQAVSYGGGGRYVAMYWSGGSGGDVMLNDGEVTVAGWWPAWRLFAREHRLGQALFSPYDFGDRTDYPVPAVHWLLADRWESTLDIGLARDVEQLLRTQPGVIAAAIDHVGRERVIEALTRAFEAHAARPASEIQRQLAQRDRDYRDLRAWLDTNLTIIEQGEQR